MPLNEADALISVLGGAASGIGVYDSILAGTRPTSRITLMIAKCEGRDYFKDIAERRLAMARTAVEVGERLISLGYRVKRIDDYRRIAEAAKLKG